MTDKSNTPDKQHAAQVRKLLGHLQSIVRLSKEGAEREEYGCGIDGENVVELVVQIERAGDCTNAIDQGHTGSGPYSFAMDQALEMFAAKIAGGSEEHYYSLQQFAEGLVAATLEYQKRHAPTPADADQQYIDRLGADLAQLAKRDHARFTEIGKSVEVAIVQAMRDDYAEQADRLKRSSEDISKATTKSTDARLARIDGLLGQLREKHEAERNEAGDAGNGAMEAS